MPKAHARDGVELYWEERGSGPTVILVPYWSSVPQVFEPLTRVLADDHRVVRWDDRGTGRSQRVGPYDVATSADDLEAVAEATGGDAVALCLIDACLRAARVAVRRPDLIAEIVCVGMGPVPVSALSGLDSMLSSEAVRGAAMQMLEADYRTAARAVLADANPQLSEHQLRERIDRQVDHLPQEVAATRIRDWVADEAPDEPGRALGDRVHVLVSAALGGGWLPQATELEGLLAHTLPDAMVSSVGDGIVSAPEQTAAVVREITARLAATSKVAGDA